MALPGLHGLILVGNQKLDRLAENFLICKCEEAKSKFNSSSTGYHNQHLSQTRKTDLGYALEHGGLDAQPRMISPQGGQRV